VGSGVIQIISGERKLFRHLHQSYAGTGKRAPSAVGIWAARAPVVGMTGGSLQNIRSDALRDARKAL
jgi:hypothetical protein